MSINSASIDTGTKEYDFNVLNGISLAVIAGKTAEKDSEKIMLFPVAQKYKELVAWLCEDINTHTPIIEQLTSALSSSSKPEQTMELPAKHNAIQVNDLISSLNSFAPLVREDETLKLAQQVAEMKIDNRSIEEWASDLSVQISKGWD